MLSSRLTSVSRARGGAHAGRTAERPLSAPARWPGHRSLAAPSLPRSSGSSRRAGAATTATTVAAAADGGAVAATTVTTDVPAAAGTAQQELQELNQATFQPFLDAAGDTLVVVDFFTDWCGPCKLIYPELVKLSAELAPRAVIVKFNCNQANKELAKALGIKVAPTFHLYRAGAKVADMTGAKVDKLRQLVADHLAPAGN